MIDTLAELFAMHGVPEHIRVDNGKLCKPGEWTADAELTVRFRPTPNEGDPAMRLLAIDLGKFKSVACLYLGEDDATYRTIET